MAISKFQEIQEREGRPMRDILIDLYNQHGHEPRSQMIIADKLGISQPTLSQWLKFLQLKQKTVLVPEN